MNVTESAVGGLPFAQDFAASPLGVISDFQNPYIDGEKVRGYPDCPPSWSKTLFGDNIGDPSAKDMTQCNEEHDRTSPAQLSDLRPTPFRRRDVNRSNCRPVSLGAVGHQVVAGYDTLHDAKPAIQVEPAAGIEQPRGRSEIIKAENWDTDIDFSLNDGAREMTEEDLTRLCLQGGWMEKLFDASTSLPPRTEECWVELENEQKVKLFAGGGTSELKNDDSIEPGIKQDKLISNDSEWPGSSFAPHIVSISPWADCYPEDPDKARELPASTGVFGLQYPADIFFTNVTPNPQNRDAVYAFQNSEDSWTEIETQISLAHAEYLEIENQTSIKTERRGKADGLFKSDIECRELSSSISKAEAEQQTGEQRKMPQHGVWKRQHPFLCSDVNTGLPPMTEESFCQL